MVTTGQGASLLSLYPFFGFLCAAEGATAVAAGVVANDFVMPLGAFVHVGSLGGGAAGSDVEGSPPFAPTEVVGSAVGVKVLAEDLAHDADHFIWTSGGIRLVRNPVKQNGGAHY